MDMKNLKIYNPACAPDAGEAMTLAPFIVTATKE